MHYFFVTPTSFIPCLVMVYELLNEKSFSLINYKIIRLYSREKKSKINGERYYRKKGLR